MLVVSLNLWKMVASKTVLCIITLKFVLCNAVDYPMCTSDTDGWTLAGELGAFAGPITTCRDNCRNNAGTTFCAVSRNGAEAQKVTCYCGEFPPETSEAGCTFICQGSLCGGPGDLRSVYPACPLGAYGSDCGTSCGHCLDDYCQVTSGECPSGCVDGYYLAGCTAACSPYCVQTTCDRSTGDCHGGCENGWYTPQCTAACPVNCDTSCHINSGDCDQGCQPEWYSNKCTERCPKNCTNTLCDHTTGGCFSCNPGWYTGNCDVPCSDNCVQTSCTMDNGACDGGCKEGWFKPNCISPCPTNCEPHLCDIDGGNCDRGCKNDYFGPHCDQPCHTNCYKKCDMKTGDCTHGCDDGYYGAVCDLNCPNNCYGLRCQNDSGNCHICQDGFYGVTCNSTCPRNCLGHICDIGDGLCKHGCKAGWNGTSCDEDVDECERTEHNNCTLYGTSFQCYNSQGYFLCCDKGVTTNGADISCVKYADLPVWIWPTMIAVLLLGAGIAVAVLKILKCDFSAPRKTEDKKTKSKVFTNKPVFYENSTMGIDARNDDVTAPTTEQNTDNYSEIQAIDFTDIEYGPSYDKLGLEKQLPPNVYDTLNK